MEKLFENLKKQEEADLRHSLVTGYDSMDLVFENKPITVVYCIDDREEATEIEPAYGGHMEIYGVYGIDSKINMLEFFCENKISELEQTLYKRSIGFVC